MSLNKDTIKRGSKKLISKDKESFDEKVLDIGSIGKLLGVGNNAARNIVAITLSFCCSI